MSVSWFINGEFIPGPAYPEESARRGEHRWVEGREPRGQNVTVGRVMTREPLVAERGDACSEALVALEEEDFHHLPVVDQEGILVGIVSDRDLISCEQGQVGKVMTQTVLVATEGTELAEVSRAMVGRRFHCVVVINLEGRPVGIVTSYDILRHLVRHPGYQLWAADR